MRINTGSFIILESVDSTNNYAMQKLYTGEAADGDCWFAIEQTNGKGRRGKHWTSQQGENIILSVVLKTDDLRVYEQFQLSVAMSLACYDLLKIYDSFNTKIKWPNDLYWNDRKAGGILIENKIHGNIWQWAVIGVGINVNQAVFGSMENRPVSLKQITGKAFDPVQLGRDLHVFMLNRWHRLKENNFENMLAEYNSVLYKINEKVKLKKQNVVFESTIKGVSSLGQLHTADTLDRTFDFDEIEWVL